MSDRQDIPWETTYLLTEQHLASKRWEARSDELELGGCLFSKLSPLLVATDTTQNS